MTYSTKSTTLFRTLRPIFIGQKALYYCNSSLSPIAYAYLPESAVKMVLHRFFAHNKAGRGEIRADIRTGTQRDAILFSVGVNACHGKRRSNEDKKKAVLTLLNDEEWGQWSNSKIAEKCQVSHTFVNSIRKSLETVSSDRQERIYKNKQGQTTTMDTSNIGKKRNSEPISMPEPEPIKQQLHSYTASDDDQELPEEDEIDWNLYEEITDKLSDSSMSTIRKVLEWIENRL